MTTKTKKPNQATLKNLKAELIQIQNEIKVILNQLDSLAVAASNAGDADSEAQAIEYRKSYLINMGKVEGIQIALRLIELRSN